MNSELKIIDYIREHIRELIPVEGLKIQFEMAPDKEGVYPDFKAKVSYKMIRFVLAGAVLSQQSASIFNAKISFLKSYVRQKGEIPFLISRYFSQDRIKQCKKEGVCFLDMSGNVFIKYKGLYIERIGFPNRFPEKRMGRNPFSDKASLILRAILFDKDKHWGIREIAKVIGLDPGFVSRMAKELEKRNYIYRIDSKIRIKDPKSVIEDWVREYSYKKNTELRFFCLSKNPDEILQKISEIYVPDKIKYALSLHAGANLVSPYALFNEVHIYILKQMDVEWFVERLKLRKVQEGANLIFLLPYYKYSVFYGRQKIKGLWVVSDLQLYLDLYNYPIRGLEQAEHIYEKRLKKILES